MIVMKFGGTSVESATAIDRVAKIVATRTAESPVVVVSAMSKFTRPGAYRKLIPDSRPRLPGDGAKKQFGLSRLYGSSR